MSVASSVVQERIKVGKATLEVGWSRTTAVATVPQAMCGASELPCDITSVHKQVEIKKTGNMKQTQACRMCSKNKSKGVTQKKFPFLCINYDDFFCHDTESSKTGSEPRCCFWAHMYESYKNTGSAPGTWITSYDQWNEQRVNKCVNDKE